jgi:hypothetical protein
MWDRRFRDVSAEILVRRSHHKAVKDLSAPIPAMTLEAFFKKHPGEYEKHKKLATVYVGAH